MYEIRFTEEAIKDVKKLTPRLKNELKDILNRQLSNDPHSGKKLPGQLEGFYSLRVTFQDRILYSLDDERKIVFVNRTRTHYIKMFGLKNLNIGGISALF